MFGLFREKILDRGKCIENVTDAIIDIWSDGDTLNIAKFSEIHLFSSGFSEDPDAVKRLMGKKLELICSATLTLLDKQGAKDLLIPVTQQTIQLIKDLLKFEIALSHEELLKESERLAGIRFSTNAGDAGKLIEKDFTDYVFKSQPDEGNIDARYLLYKQLSGLERTTIFKISTAIRQSKV